MKEITLTQGKVSLVDEEDFEKLNQFKWCATSGRIAYATRAVRINEKHSIVYMHREILNSKKGVQVDHINGNGLDNRKENLRPCTHAQNMCNRTNAHKNNKLGIKGVSWDKNMKKFRAQLWIGNKRIHLGFYNVMGDADSAYRIAEEKYFGEFARAS